MDRFFVESAPIADAKTYVSGQIRLSGARGKRYLCGCGYAKGYAS